MTEVQEQEKEMTEEEKKNHYNCSFNDDGFFVAFMHESRGQREVLGFLEQCKDIVKAYYVNKHVKEQQAKGLIRPNGEPPKQGGFFRGFRNKWRT